MEDLELKNLNILGVKVFELEDFFDSRGSFTEIFSKKFLDYNKLNFFDIVQVNLSVSKKNTFRGIHFSNSKKLQHKLVMCLEGSISDFVVDTRVGSPTFGQVDQFELNSNNRKLIFIPAGCGHGFFSKMNQTKILYAQSSEYSPHEEFDLSCLDKSLGLNLESNKKLILSKKDKSAKNLDELKKNGVLPLYTNIHA
jgi:dTDP-4-dehydrorhamnose 3,5-epimerase